MMRRNPFPSYKNETGTKKKKKKKGKTKQNKIIYKFVRGGKGKK